MERFTQEDVYRVNGLNLYAYCGANPVMYADPSGYLFTFPSEFDKSNIWAMENGYTSKVRDKNLYSKWFGKVYNIDHAIEIQDGGYVYDLDNISILAPKAHEDKTNTENAKRKKC